MKRLPILQLILLWLLSCSSLTLADRITYFHYDATGTAIMATDEQANVLWKRAPTAYGETPEFHPAMKKYNHRMTVAGHYDDWETGLIYMGKRYYSPKLGRFLTPDPVGVHPHLPQSFNRYGYANNNPYKFVDPDGRDPICGSGMGTWQPGTKHGHGQCIENYKPNERSCATGYCGAMNGTGNGVSTKNDLYGLALIAPGLMYGATLIPEWAITVANRAGYIPKGLPEGAQYAQKTFNPMFSKGGAFAGQSVDDVAAALRSGGMKPSDVPIDYIIRDGRSLILNTRSSQALEAAGIPRSQWNAVNRTGEGFYEGQLNGQLSRNPGSPFDTVRRSGGN